MLTLNSFFFHLSSKATVLFANYVFFSELGSFFLFIFRFVDRSASFVRFIHILYRCLVQRLCTTVLFKKSKHNGLWSESITNVIPVLYVMLIISMEFRIAYCFLLWSNKWYSNYVIFLDFLVSLCSTAIFILCILFMHFSNIWLYCLIFSLLSYINRWLFILIFICKYTWIILTTTCFSQLIRLNYVIWFSWN